MEQISKHTEKYGGGVSLPVDAVSRDETADADVTKLLSRVCEKNVFQAKALSGFLDSLSPDEREGLRALIGSYVKQGDTAEHLADCYLKFVRDIMEEQLYFIRNRRYRYSGSRDVNEFFYRNPEYMEYYMKGLAVSTYLMEAHRKCREWYGEKIRGLSGEGVWLDVGVGHGEYFVLAARLTDFKRYLGIDISKTCVLMCRQMVEQRVPRGEKDISVREQDFFRYEGPCCDAVVLGEVLEHVERPAAFFGESARDHRRELVYLHCHRG